MATLVCKSLGAVYGRNLADCGRSSHVRPVPQVEPQQAARITTQALQKKTRDNNNMGPWSIGIRFGCSLLAGSASRSGKGDSC
eukprot:2613107-Amphidinium_carterae.1